jgi:hypothetical protein
MKDFIGLAMAARRWTPNGATLVAALRATFHLRGTSLPDDEVVAFSALY